MKTVTGRFGSMAPGGRSVIWAATGRFGGHSLPPFDELNLADYVGDEAGRVQRNRQVAAASIGLTATDLVLMQGVHGANVVVVEQGSPQLGEAPGFDALVTKTPGVGLVALAADCVPIVLADVANQVIGAVHCGWRGLAAGVVPAALAQMYDLGADQVHAVIGPSICANCYPVPPQRVFELNASLSEPVAAAACPKSSGVEREMAVACIDVGAGARAQLAESGVTAITLAGCTAHSDGLFSYRRDGQTGRQGMLIRLDDPMR
ncbi:unannotated protein [freshwater metagenome]|uniref:Unannotated protein n=1 Tax=freshwater metagenome TaxID=449393 RepID=A0A6J7RH76_9ZZZZ